MSEIAKKHNKKSFKQFNLTQQTGKMISIKDKLYLLLISMLIVISLLFIVATFVLHSFGFNLTLEAIGVIISVWAAILVLIPVLGLRLIDDALKRYETFAKPRINNLKLMMDSIEKELLTLTLINTLSRIRDSQKSLSDLEKYGRFFLTKLYPQESLEKIRRLIENVEHFLNMVKELEPYWEKPRPDLFLNLLILGWNKKNDGLRILFNDAKVTADKLTKEKPEIIKQIRTQRDKALGEVEKIIEELNNFYEIN